MLKPKFSEKTMLLAKTRNQYTFSVDVNETKNSVKLAIKKAFGVNPVNVKIANIIGKAKRRGNKKTVTWESDLKKAVVKLPEKEKIDLFDTKEKKTKKQK